MRRFGGDFNPRIPFFIFKNLTSASLVFLYLRQNPQGKCSLIKVRVQITLEHKMPPVFHDKVNFEHVLFYLKINFRSPLSEVLQVSLLEFNFIPSLLSFDNRKYTYYKILLTLTRATQIRGSPALANQLKEEGRDVL